MIHLLEKTTAGIVLTLCIFLVGCATSLPPHAHKEFQLGKEAFTMHHYDDAIKYLSKHVEKFPEESESRLLLGCALLEKARLKEAVDQFKECIRRNPENQAEKSLIKTSIFEKSKMYAHEGKKNISMKYIMAYLTIDRNDVDSLIYMAESLLDRGDVRNAIGFINKLAVLDPYNPRAMELFDSISSGFH